MKDLLKGLPESVKEVLKVIIPFISVVVLFVLIGKFGVSKVVNVKNKIVSSEKDASILTNKLSVLQSISQTSVDSVESVTGALPGSNPSLAALSQIKNLAAKNNIILSNIKAGNSAKDTSNLSFVTIAFQADGQRSVFLAFLKDIEGIAPITRINKIKISENGGITSANVSTKTYWALFPKTIPTVTQAISDLTVSEKETLIKSKALIQPTFSNILPSVGGVNSAPFGQ